MVFRRIFFHNRNWYYHSVQHFESAGRTDSNHNHWTHVVADCRLYVFATQRIFHVQKFVHDLFVDPVLAIAFAVVDDDDDDVMKVAVHQHYYF